LQIFLAVNPFYNQKYFGIIANLNNTKMGEKIMIGFKKTCLVAQVIAALALGSSQAIASNGTGLLGFVLVLQNPNVAIIETPVTTDAAACASVANQWAIDIDTSVGKSILAILLTAKATGTPVRVVGTGACTYTGDREDISWVLSS
jgi:hypothetical protein